MNYFSFQLDRHAHWWQIIVENNNRLHNEHPILPLFKSFLANGMNAMKGMLLDIQGNITISHLNCWSR